MKIMLETTEWADGQGANHIYVFEEFKGTARTAKAVAYSPWGIKPVQKFSTPMNIDLRGRTFEAVK